MLRTGFFFMTLALIGVLSVSSAATAESNASGNCGKRNVGGVSAVKRQGVDESEFGEFPWTTIVFKSEKRSDGIFTEYPCGGSLIHPKVVLTTAACAQNQPKNLTHMTVKAGVWNFDNADEDIPSQTRHVAEVVIHEDYIPGNRGSIEKENDVAMLILDEEFNMTTTVGVICLPPAGIDAPQGTCIATGFGLHPSSQSPEVMKKLELPIVDRATCQEKLKPKKETIVVGNSFICAGGEYLKDMCEGDTGSPLACLAPGKPDKYMQSGIVSWGFKCGQKGIPGVYSNVAFMRPWIDEQLSKRNIDMTPYAL